MPSIDHEILVEVFRGSPEILVRLTAAAPGVVLPAYEELRVASGDLVELAPTERRADLVVLLVRGVPVHVLIAEVQLRIVFEELLRRFPDIEPVGPRKRLRSNFLNGIKSLTVRFTPERH